MPIPTDTQTEAQERLALMNLMDNSTYAIPKRQIDENLLIATWNIQSFSEKKTWRALKYMADIIERFDIVAIQEIRSDLRGVAKLQELLPGNYKMIISDVTGNTERFAFFYDERTIKPTGLVAELGLDLDTDTHEGFQIHRMPYMASFRAGRFDFIIVTVHIFDSSSTFKEKEIDTLGAELRRIAERDETKVVDKDIFVVGDFNIKKKADKYYKALSKHGFIMPDEMDDLKTNLLQFATYDKIAWVDGREDFKYANNCNVIPFHQVLYQDKNPPGGKKQISDHLPLWAEFKINELTQQLNQIINPNSLDNG